MAIHPLDKVFVHDDGSLAVTCEKCDGEGELVEFFALSPADETPCERVHPCDRCRGQGWIEIEIEEIEDERDEDEIDAVPLAQLLRQPTA